MEDKEKYLTFKDLKRLVRKIEREALAAGVLPVKVDEIIISDAGGQPLPKLGPIEIRRTANKT